MCKLNDKIKGTVNVISSDPLCKDDIVWFTIVPLRGGVYQAWNSSDAALNYKKREISIYFVVRLG